MSNRSRRLIVLSVAAFASAFVGTSAPLLAGPIAPGETRSGEEYLFFDVNDPRFAGDTVFSSTTPFEVVYEQEDGSDANFIRGTFTHLVIRESTGRLAFHYRLQETQQVGGAIDFENLFVDGFAGFDLDVFSDQDSESGEVSRSADGDVLDFVGQEEPFSGNFVVRTNATAFEEGADISVLARAQTGDPIGGIDRTLVLGPTAVPAADDGGPGPNPIPLPPAAWAALATMGGFGAVKRLRRRRP